MRINDDHLSRFMRGFLSSPEDRLALSTGVVRRLSGTWQKLVGGGFGRGVLEWWRLGGMAFLSEKEKKSI